MMKTRYKVLISFLLGICLILIGISMGGTIHFHNFSWIENIDIRSSEKRLGNRIGEFEGIEKLELDCFSNINMNIYEEDNHHNNTIKVVVGNPHECFEMKQSGHTLELEMDHNPLKKHSHDILSIDIYVPKGYIFNEVDIDLSVGKSTLSHIKTYALKIDNGAGKVDFNDLYCLNELNIDNAAGKVDVSMQKIIGLDYDVNIVGGQVMIDGKQYLGMGNYQSYQGHNTLIDIDCTAGSVDIRMEERDYE